VGENDRIPRGGGGLRRRVIAAIGLFCLLIVIFHRPLLLFVGRRLAIHFAAKHDLILSLELRGNPFVNLIATKIHAVSVDSGDIESLDLDYARIDYDLFDLIRGRKLDFLRNIEAHSARVVLNPSHEQHPRRQPKPDEHATLPSLFPERVKLSDVSVIIRNRPDDFVIEHVDLVLDPRAPGELRIAGLQLPTGQNWSNLKGQTSYAGKNLIVRDLASSDPDRVSQLNIDGSRLGAKQLALNLEAKLGEGTISIATTLGEAGSGLKASVHLQVKDIAAESLNRYAVLPEGSLGGEIEDATVDGSGVLNAPRTWTGNINARLKDFRGEGFHFDRSVLQIAVQNGAAILQTADVVQGANEFHIRGSADLPVKLNEFGRAPASFEISGKDIDLREFTSDMAQHLSGNAETSGKIDIKNGIVTAAFSLTTGPVKSSEGSIEKINANLTASKTMPAPGNRKPWFSGLKSKLDLDISNAEIRGHEVDSLTASVSSVNDSLQIDQMVIRRRRNSFNVAGRYNLPEDIEEASPTGEVEFELAALELADFWADDSPDKWSGPLQGAGEIRWKNGIGNGEFWISGANLRTRGLAVNGINAQCTMANNVVYLNDVSANLNEKDSLRGNGVVDLWGKHHYAGKLAANIADLSKLKPLLRDFGNENDLAGSLKIDWAGGGDAIKFQNSGQLKLTLENGRYGNLKSLQANIDASYSPDGLEIPTIFIRSDRMDFQAIVEAKGETLEVAKIQLDQGQAKYASGYVSLPFIWKNLGTNAAVIPATGNVAASFQSENIDLKKLFEDFGAKPVASGTLNVKLDAEGAISSPDARLEVEMKDLRSEKLANLEPAKLHLTAQSGQAQLTISGKLEQAKVQPIELTANLPFDIPKIARDKKLADETPLKANLKMPRSSVNFVRQFIPAVQEVDGDAALNVDLSGTIARPVFKGQADMTINVARTNDPTFPALQNFKARLNFTNDVLSLDQFSGELSGGRFTLSGRISIPKLTTANVDLAFKADSALVARSDALTVRTDADVRFKGPLGSVSVTGAVSLTNSHFLKNLDLIPISLPGRPAPEPPSSRPRIVLPAPLRDWKFDVAIKTKDPLLIRGNLATGGAVADLHFVGTGLRPGLNGLVRLKDVEATLPFSRLQIGYGFLYFNPDDSLNPKLDLHGTSVIQDYTVHVYIYGTSLAPEAVFSSEPPLPQEDIISLLSTGTTREQLTGNNSVLAGRAAMLLVQQVYRKVFKKGQATQTNSVFDRFDLDVGTVDPRTGQQQATARFKINKQFVVVGDVGVSGDYKGMLKYLIRFH